MVDVSVIIPVYNTEQYLTQCLDTLSAQTLPDFEVICVDDASNDGSPGILAEFARRDARFTVVENVGKGAAHARNRGLDLATGDYLMFLDSDDFFEPTLLEKAHAACVRDDADICIFKTRYHYVGRDHSVEGDWSLRMELVPTTVPFNRLDMGGRLFDFVTPNIWNKMMRRSFVEDRGLRFATDLERDEDLALCYTALAEAERITVLDEALVNYRKGVPGSMQETIHEAPFAICDALEVVMRDTRAAGVFEQIERDFVNAALYQCLFTLDDLKTEAAAETFFHGIKDRYFAELGIQGRDREYFFDPSLFDRYERVVSSTWDSYLFDRTRALRAEMTRAWDIAQREKAALRKRVERVSARTLGQVWGLREKLDQTRDATRHEKKRTKKAEASLGRIEKSRAYRISRVLTALPRGIHRMVTRQRGAR